MVADVVCVESVGPTIGVVCLKKAASVFKMFLSEGVPCLVIRLRMRYPGIPIKVCFFGGLRGLIAGYTIKSWWSVHPQSIVKPYIQYIYIYIYLINPIKVKCLGVWLDPSMKWWTVFKFENEVWRPYFGAATITVASCGYNWDVF